MSEKLLRIHHYPDPVLRETASEITKFDSELEALSENMLRTMYAHSGIGLAATQVGILQRIIVMDVSEERNNPQVLINPKIKEQKGKIKSEEGCLSIPDFRETISRAAEITIEAQSLKGEAFSVSGDDILSRCLQHEIDHLNGVLFVDHLSRLKRQLFKRWLQKQELHEA